MLVSSYQQGTPISELVQRFGISSSRIRQILQREASRRHASDEYGRYMEQGDIRALPVRLLPISLRAKNAMAAEKFETVSDVLENWDEWLSQSQQVPNVGRKTVAELRAYFEPLLPKKTSAPRRSSSSGSPYERTIGFSRALRVDRQIWVSGTAPVEPDGSSTPGGAGNQALRCLAIIRAALEELGGSLPDVVRTRIYIVDAADAEAVGEAHAAVFGDIAPAATMVVVAQLLRSEWLVEIEAEAVIAAA